MKTNPDSQPNDDLLEAALHDDAWQLASADMKAGALQAFHVHQRVRRVRRWVGGVAACAAIMTCFLLWWRIPTAPQRPTAPPLARIALPPAEARQLTDQELVASFPPGTCFIAEVDGKKELVFFHPEAERTYITGPVRAR